MHVNNEIGAVMPIEEAGAAIKEKNPATLFMWMPYSPTASLKSDQSA